MRTPSPALVAESFLKANLVSGFDYGIGTTLPALTVADQKGLPKDNWGKKIWVTPRGIGSTRWEPLPTREAAVTLIVWSKPYDKRRHWADAEALAEELFDLGLDWTSSVDLVIPYPGYKSTKISNFRPISGVRRIEGDPQELGRVEFDVQVNYSF